MANKKTNKKTNNKTNNKKKNNIVLWILCGILAVALVALFIIGATGVFSKGKTASEPENTTELTDSAETGTTQQTADSNIKTYTEIPQGHPVVTVTMENGKSFKMELYPEYAPQTVANFVALAEDGFYDGLTFHRVVEDFMAQGGDPEGTGMGGAEQNIVGEFSSNGFTQNTLSHTRGVVSMARSQAPDSASSQFFICYDDASFLDGEYAAFGKVIEGMDVVDGFLDVERTANSMGELASPVEPIVMKSVTVEK